MPQPDYENDLVFPPLNLEEQLLEELKEEVEDLKKDLKSALWYKSAQNEEINNLKQLLKECKKEFTDISTRACYPYTNRLHTADFDRLFDKCENILTRIEDVIK